MKKGLIIICSIILLLAAISGGLGLYIVNTPEYALKTIIEDVNTSGIEGLEPHLTAKAKKLLIQSHPSPKVPFLTQLWVLSTRTTMLVF